MDPEPWHSPQISACCSFFSSRGQFERLVSFEAALSDA
ncbi:hypothetical protein X751_02480 [Mesorhizobium sp. LNJC395A00]|nr:hypothetical protein X751_02480 [Mesorhizobium sp. LNJC395A00]